VKNNMVFHEGLTIAFPCSLFHLLKGPFKASRVSSVILVKASLAANPSRQARTGKLRRSGAPGFATRAAPQATPTRGASARSPCASSPRQAAGHPREGE
jgi:hypothetical protein